MKTDIDVPPKVDWKIARHNRRLRQRRLPPGLRADIDRIRRDDLAEAIMDIVFDCAEAEASDDSFISLGNTLASRRVLAPVVERQLLRRFDDDPTFRAYIRNQIASGLRTAHLLTTDPSTPVLLPELNDFTDSRADSLRLRSSIGLGTASFLEAEPEEWWAYVMSDALQRHRTVEMKSGSEHAHTLRLLSMGAGVGAAARYVTALDRRYPRTDIDEQDCVLPECTALPCVNSGRQMPTDPRDVVAMVLPSPACPGAANHRRIYRGDQSRFFDLSCLGPINWNLAVGLWLELMKKSLSREGRAYLLVPSGIRTEHGYAGAPQLLDWVLAHVRKHDLVVLDRRRVVEIEPVAQPFVGRRRATRTSMIVRWPV